MHTRNSFESKIFEEYQKKPLKSSLELSQVPLHAVSFYEQDYEKQQGPGTSYHSLGCKKGVFELFQTLNLLIYGSQFMKSQLFLLHLTL